MPDDSQLFATGVKYVQSAGAAGIDVAFNVYFHTVRDAGLFTGDVDDNLVALPGQGAVGLDLKGANVAPAGVVDVENALIRREHQTIGNHEIAD